MNITINAQNLRLTSALEEYAQKKLDRLDRYLPNITKITVDLAREHTNRGANVTSAQITLRHERGAILRAEERVASDEYDAAQAAINGAVEKMYRRIERFKGKKNVDRKGRERFVATLEELDAAEAIPAYEDLQSYEDEFDADGNLQGPTLVVRRKNISMTAMNELEAIEQMELLGHPFFMFYNTNTGSVNVLYKRDNGGYGVLVPHLE